MRMPLSGCSRAKRSRISRSTGMSLRGPDDARLAARGQREVFYVAPVTARFYSPWRRRDSPYPAVRYDHRGWKSDVAGGSPPLRAVQHAQRTANLDGRRMRPAASSCTTTVSDVPGAPLLRSSRRETKAEVTAPAVADMPHAQPANYRLERLMSTPGVRYVALHNGTNWRSFKVGVHLSRNETRR